MSTNVLFEQEDVIQLDLNKERKFKNLICYFCHVKYCDMGKMEDRSWGKGDGEGGVRETED